MRIILNKVTETVMQIIHDQKMLEWLKMQVRILEAWREEVAERVEIDVPVLMRLERHYAWLSSEVSMLEMEMNKAQADRAGPCFPSTDG